MPRIEAAKLGTQVHAVLEDMIANQRFEPGARINVEQLARELGVSRTPLWEAIHRLEQERLLVHVPRRGVFLVQADLRHARELYEVREVLEGMAARLAADRISEEALARLDTDLSRQAEVVARRDLVRYSRSDFEFHAVVYEASGNGALRESLERIKKQLRAVRVDVAPILETLHEDHRRVHAALRDRDPERAEAAFRRHNRNIVRVIQAAIDAEQRAGRG